MPPSRGAGASRGRLGGGHGVAGSGSGSSYKKTGGIDFKEQSTPAARAAALFKQAQAQRAAEEASARRRTAEGTRATTANATAAAAKAAAAQHRAVQQAAKTLSDNALPPASGGGDDAPVAVSKLVKALAAQWKAQGSLSSSDLPKVMSLAKALIAAKRATPAALQEVSKLILTDIVHWPACDPAMRSKINEGDLRRAEAACQGAGAQLESESNPSEPGPSSSSGSTQSSPSKGYSWEGKREANDLESFVATQSQHAKRRKISKEEERLSREWGNPLVPLDAQGEAVPHGVGTADDDDEDTKRSLPTYDIPCIVDEEQLRGRTAVVNRAPVMTLWATILLERMGFQRREALSLAQCYVSTTSTARAVTLGLTSAAERDRAQSMGPKQPHFVLMGTKLPVLQLQKRTPTGDVGEYRALYDGQLVDPQRAFDYIFRAFYQTLPYVYGALVLLADSYLDPTGADADADGLHAVAWDLYCDFRPETGGEWGKRARFSCDTALALRKGAIRSSVSSSKEEEQGVGKGGGEEVKREDGDAAQDAVQREKDDLFGQVSEEKADSNPALPKVTASASVPDPVASSSASSSAAAQGNPPPATCSLSTAVKSEPS